jgi:hypothetical protein
MPFDHSVLTDVGWDALTDAEAGELIEYLHMEAGDGTVSGDAEMYGLVALKSEKLDFPITGFSNDGNGQITLIGSLSSKNNPTGFYFREVGVKARVSGGPELLYCVANAGPVADWIPPSTEQSIVVQSVQIIVKIDRAPSVTVNVTPGLDVTCQNIGPGTVGPGWFRDKIGQICWFKRLVEGTLINFTETPDTITIDNPGADTAANIGGSGAGVGVFRDKDANQVLNLKRINSPKATLSISETSDLISIDVWQIDIDLDMWVYLGAPNVFPNFSTIQNALNYLSVYQIKPEKFVTIWVAAGIWTNSSRINIKHPQGAQIKIIGTADATINISGVTNIGGTNKTVRLTGPANAFSSWAVGDFFFYDNQSSNSGQCISGIWKVTAKTSNTIDYNTFFRGTFPDLSFVTGGTVKRIRTVVKFAAGQGDGFSIYTGLELLSNMVITVEDAAHNDSTGHTGGISVKGGEAVFTYVFGYDIWNQIDEADGFIAWAAGTYTAYHCAATLCSLGFRSWDNGGIAHLYSCFANSNRRAGCAVGNSNMKATLSFACGNGQDGWFAGGSQLGLIVCWGLNNAGSGAGADGRGLISALEGSPSQGAFAAKFQNNGTYDVGVTRMSGVIRSMSKAIVYTTTNLAPNTLSADGSLFSP